MFNFSLRANEFNGKDHPCAEYTKTICSGVEKISSKIARCLKEHKKELSLACNQKVSEYKESLKTRNQEIIANCKEDSIEFCIDTPRRRGGKLKCLLANRNKLSDQCKAALPK